MMEYFEYMGKKSTDFDIYIEAEITSISPEVDISFEKVPGVDGEIAVSDQTLNNVTKVFPCFILPSKNQTFENRAHDISNWLKGTINWSPLFFSGDKEYIYTAIFHEQFDIEKSITFYHKVPLSFTIKPYKYMKIGLSEISISNGQKLTNLGTRESKPKIKIVGSGDITLNYGGQQFILKGVDKGIIIDCLTESAFSLDGTRAQWDRVYTYPFPLFPKGDFSFSWTGNAAVSIIPRWEAVV